jgi:hypothetical protein
MYKRTLSRKSTSEQSKGDQSPSMDVAPSQDELSTKTEQSGKPGMTEEENVDPTVQGAENTCRMLQSVMTGLLSETTAGLMVFFTWLCWYRWVLSITPVRAHRNFQLEVARRHVQKILPEATEQEGGLRMRLLPDEDGYQEFDSGDCPDLQVLQAEDLV